MATMIATGLGACCCPDCLMFSEGFDCCYYTVPICDYPDISMGCCIDRATWGTTPSRDIGGKWAWQKATGQWWKAVSPIPRYTILGGAPCNDGALWEVSGSGTITSAIGFPNTGFRLVFTVLTPVVGTDLTVHAWSSIDDPSSGFKIRIRFLTENGINTIRIEACDKVLTISGGVHARTTFNITYVDGKYVVIDLGTEPGPDSSMVCCGVSLSGGWKFSFTNNSGSDEYGPIPLILDDVIVYKELVYYTQPETSRICFRVGCECVSEKTNKKRKKLPDTLKMDMYIRCREHSGGGNPPEYLFHWTLYRKPPPCNTLRDINRDMWVSDALDCPTGPPGNPNMRWYWGVSCYENGFNLAILTDPDDCCEMMYFLDRTNCDPLKFGRITFDFVRGEAVDLVTYVEECLCGEYPLGEGWVDVYE